MSGEKRAKIIAVDFDGTLCENKWPEIGEPNEKLIWYLREQQAAGAKIILWTCRVGDRLEEAVRFCYEQGLIFDAVNENLLEVLEWMGGDTRKIFADEYINDRMSKQFNLPFVKEEQSSMKLWAEREIEIACERERKNSIWEGDWEYGCACYESAFKAFDSLMEDVHSGYSIGFTQAILNRLIDGRPLTPIEDVEDVWNDVRDYSESSGYTQYQCKRMSSLFKEVHPDGTVKYHDVNRFAGVNINDQNSTYHCGLVSRIGHEMFPITMPYCPANKPFKVYCEDFLTDRKNGDFDTVGIFYVIKPDGEKVEINRFFKESKDGWAEIDKAEYDLRKKVVVVY